MQNYDQNAQLSWLVGVDALGRTFSPAAVNKDKTVGMFFWLWMGQHPASGIYDATKILAQPDGADKLFYQDCPDSPDHQAHFWGEPLWGYYNSQDRWVIRKQLELLTLAGVDFIAFDATNVQTYPQVYTRIMEEIEALQELGWHPPKAAFYTHTCSLKTVRILYEELYRPGLHRDAWYFENGKPMIIAYTDPEPDIAWVVADAREAPTYNPEPFGQEILDFFTFRKPLWPLDDYDPEGFPWIEWTFPQPLHGDMMNATVASHPNVPFTFTLTRGLENWGRGWDPDQKCNRPECVAEGLFFERQWEEVLKQDPSLVFVGGWNEWIAFKQLWQGEYMLCDAVNQEFSRDIEPMKGGHEDNFYLQLIRNMRRYRGAPAEEIRGERTYHVIAPAMARDEAAICESVRYTQPAPVNPLKKAVVNREEDHISFTLHFEKPVDADFQSQIALYLGVGEPHLGAWESYDWRINCGSDGWQLTCLAEGRSLPLEACVRDKLLTLRLSLTDLVAAEAKQIYFKAVTENDGVETDIMHTYTQGCALPPGRLSYAYPL